MVRLEHRLYSRSVSSILQFGSRVLVVIASHREFVPEVRVSIRQCLPTCLDHLHLGNFCSPYPPYVLSRIGRAFGGEDLQPGSRLERSRSPFIPHK